MAIIDLEKFYPTTKQEWRKWLKENHNTKDGVWVILYKKNTGEPTISWSDAVDEALCFGWIDSVKRKLDEEKSIQFFSRRKPKSTWSKINKDKVKLLIEDRQMTAAGLKCIEVAQENGSWDILNTVDNLTIPTDLQVALKAKDYAMDFFMTLSKSVRKAMLQWLVLAKRPETRQKRITEIAELANEGKKPKQF